MLVGGGVGDLVGRRRARTSSVPWPATPHAGGLVGEVDLVAVPATAPRRRRSSRRCPRSRDGRTTTIGAPERARDAGDGARVLAGVEELDRARDLQLGVRRDRVDVARARGGGARSARVAGCAAPAAARRGLAVLVRRRRRAAVVGRRSSRRLARRARAGAAQRAAAARRRGCAPVRVVEALADPALVRRRAACTARRRCAAGPPARKTSGVLAAQQRAPADVAGDDGRVRADRLAGHPPARRAARSATG